MTAVTLSTGERWRGLLAIALSAGVAGITYGCLPPLMAIILERQGHPNWAIGLNGAAAFAATILLGPLVPKLFSRLGFFNAMAIAVVGEVTCLFLLLVWPDIWYWAGLRFLIGFFGTILWIGSEVWIVAMAPERVRGRAIAFYMMAISGGFALGPVVIQVAGSESSLPFLICAGLTLFAGFLIWTARGMAPDLPAAPKAAIALACRIAPLVMAAALMAGFVDMSAVTHLVNYGQDAGLSEETALMALTIMLVANLVMQFPVGWLADRVDKRKLLISFGVVFFVAPLLINETMGQSLLVWPVLIVWGICSLGIYTVALTILGERFDASLLASANAAIVVLYQVGGVGGSFAGGSAMDLFGYKGLMWVFALAAFLFLSFAAYRTWKRRKLGLESSSDA